MQTYEEKINETLLGLEKIAEHQRHYFKKHSVLVPSRKEVIKLVKRMQSLMFPDYFMLDGDEDFSREEIAERLLSSLKLQLSAAYSFFDEAAVVDTESIAFELFGKLPEIKEILLSDVEALYEGDPAARSPEEVILSYPGFYAISIYRIAHEFYKMGVPYMPRLMTEFAHEKTGIDIHAGATVGDHFFIDHGTGIVIGETTTIGSRVKIYQGVTLGAKSFELDSDGNPVKGIKRHPDIGNDCIIYANATILGGNTKIGDGSVIGGNVWLTHSVEPGSVVYYNAK
ncbi:MAG: serine acetyltransferase [Clostridia bacterium]|nr:serine acetyltransferase [Clostridia bacterium]